MSSATDLKLLSLLRSEGPQSPASLMRAMGVSQPTLFRSTQNQSEAVMAVGGARNRMLVALRVVRGLGTTQPVFRISETGAVLPVGSLFTIYPRGCVLVSQDTPLRPGIYPGLPFYLDDIKPQGFIGRSFTTKHRDLRLPPRTVDWSNDDILEAIARRGEDLIGDLVVGAESFERYQVIQSAGEPKAIKAGQPERAYAQLAQAAVDGEPAGSSAGGEHPKFGATLRMKDGSIARVLVKFSPAGDSFAASRWRDLLVAEHRALEMLRETGIAAVQSRVIETADRFYLETVRFDRIGARGRRGMLSLAALEIEWTGGSPDWASSAEALWKQKRISDDDLRAVRLLECFGRLIANSDRHPGNLSFFWEPGDSRVRLAPNYDMLPMLYAPSAGGEDPGREFTIPTYNYSLLPAWKVAMPLAVRYWQSLAEERRLSKTFRAIAARNLGNLQAAI